MIGGVVAIIITYWYYRGAIARHLPGFQWAFAGLIVYYIPNFIWSLGIAKPWLARLHSQTPSMIHTLVGFSSVLVGAAVALLVYFLILRRKSG